MERIRKSVLTNKEQISWTPQRKTFHKSLFAISRVDSENVILDEKTKAEVETRIAVHIRPEEREELFKQEGVTRNQYINPTILHRIKNFLEI